MLNALIRFALQNRVLILIGSMALLVYGSVVTRSLPVDVLPDLTRPRVVLITEAHGYAPEEVETLLSFPLESVLNGASGVMAVRSSSDIGLSVVYAEFDWDTDVYTARQVVQERIATVIEQLPDGVRPQMGPISSLLGQIMLIGVSYEEEDVTEQQMLDLRTHADWVIKKRLLTIPGISQVITMGGGRKQFQVLADVHKLHTYEVTLHEVEEALKASNLNVTGGYLDKGSQELLARGIGRLRNVADIENVVVKYDQDRSVLVKHVARVTEGAQVKRGDSRVNGRDAVVLTIQKQPGADTRRLTEQINRALDELRAGLPPGATLSSTYEQRDFIDYSIENVVEAVRDGAILVAIILFLFLLNVRTTFITLTAIPLSLLSTALVFHWFGLSINVMTLGGIAVAMGELVDDAIVDVENIFHRLRQNAQLESPRPVLRVIYDASREVRGAIFISTLLVIVVFSPLFALTGMEGRLFAPLGIAYIVSIVASTVVSLTVTPVLSYFLLGKARSLKAAGDGFFLRGLKSAMTPLIRTSMTPLGLTIIGGATFLLATWSVVAVVGMGKDFLPSFDEGAAQVNVFLPPGTSLDTTRDVSRLVDGRFQKLLKSDANPTGPLLAFTNRMGRAEEDEHVMGVNVAEYVLKLNPESGLSRQALIDLLQQQLKDIPGIQHEADQPIAHLISHMISGVQAQIAIKLFGDDLDTLRRKADEIKATIRDIPGIAEPVVEQQQNIPQLQIELDRNRLAFYGVSAEYVNHFIETSLNGAEVTTLLDGQRTFAVIVRLDDEYREDYLHLHELRMELPQGIEIPLGAVADIREGVGPNTISREEGRRRIVVRVNTTGRDLSGAVEEIQQRIRERVELPEGYFVVLGGQFEAQQQASRRILILSLVALVVTFGVLYSAFPSVGLVLQILVALPAAFIGGVAAIALTGQSLSVASMVGFISLGGIAARNGILLIGHYLQLYREQGYTREMILAGSLERLAPVLMTALTTGIGLVPLVIGGHLPGKEILFPVATVILGGLCTSTLCEFLIRPGLYWFFSADLTERLAQDQSQQDVI